VAAVGHKWGAKAPLFVFLNAINCLKILMNSFQSLWRVHSFGHRYGQKNACACGNKGFNYAIESGIYRRSYWVALIGVRS
jgi:hypothetical protein